MDSGRKWNAATMFWITLFTPDKQSLAVLLSMAGGPPKTAIVDFPAAEKGISVTAGTDFRIPIRITALPVVKWL